jgi:hypothetical protein
MKRESGLIDYDLKNRFILDTRKRGVSKGHKENLSIRRGMMLVESIILVGKPIVHSDLSNEQRIRWLTDIDSENCKNYFQNVFLVEIDDNKIAYHYIKLGSGEGKNFVVDTLRNSSFPILYPQGGNPLHAQGVYPAPCYLMYDPHIKLMKDPQTFASKVILPRLKNTVSYREQNEEQLISIATRVAKIIAGNYEIFISEAKQLGILYIYDHALPIYLFMPERKTDDERYLWIAESKLKNGQHLYIDSDKCIEGIIEAKFAEAKTLGYEKNAISTFTNKREAEVSSIYNKFWLWLSPTWEMPRSIYWAEDGWTNGIKIDRANYEAFLYGSQFLKQITVPISSGILKEMFAPMMNVEAKKYMKPTSFEKIYGVPIVLPLVSSDSKQLYEKYQRLLKGQDKSESDIHLELLAGIHKVIPKTSDDHRLIILYYSGDLSRGDVHIRMIIEDIIPSVAMKLQKIMTDLRRKHIMDIHKAFGSKRDDKQDYRMRSLPSMLANAYGPGYIWSTLQTVFHRQPLYLNRLYQSTAIKLNELANKEDHWGMVDELIFHYAFIFFYREYHREVLKTEKEVKSMSDWIQLLEKYHMGRITIDDLRTAEELGFITGLLLKQFSNSYYRETGKEFVKQRVMKFGSKLTPEMVWKGGVVRCEELANQWDMKLAGNFYSVLPHVLLAFLDADKQNLLSKDKDKFMTAFWSGHLMYQKPKGED